MICTCTEFDPTSQMNCRSVQHITISYRKHIAGAHCEQRNECHEEVLRYPELIVKEILINETPGNEAAVICVEN